MWKKNINVYRRYALAGATISVAISIGFLMQSSEPGYAGQTVGKVKPGSVPVKVTQASLNGSIETDDPTERLPIPPQDKMGKVSLPEPQVVLLVSNDVPVGVLPKEESAPLLNCSVELTATPSAAAMVDLYLSATCLGGERVTFQHKGLKFTDTVGLDGDLRVTVPALSEKAIFVAAFGNGEGAIVQTEVGSLPFYDRVAVQWQGDRGLELHAREFGADYGTDGHVWREAPRDVTVVVDGTGGFLTRLGNPDIGNPLLAEVYTFPTGTATIGGTVEMSLEAEITDRNCGKEVKARSFELLNGSAPKVHDLEMSLPDCTAAGEFLVLKNLVEDLTIASN